LNFIEDGLFYLLLEKQLLNLAGKACVKRTASAFQGSKMPGSYKKLIVVRIEENQVIITISIRYVI
jgi:hypothetical protein